MSEKRTIDDATHQEWEDQNKREAKRLSEGAAHEQQAQQARCFCGDGLGGSAPTPRTDAVDQQAQRIVSAKPFGASSADTINEIVALYSAHARSLEASLVNAYAHSERMTAGWLALKEALDTLEEDAIAQRAFWGESDKHGIAAEAERIYEKAKAALSPNHRISNTEE